jgi:TPP-dependent pyruvate/acetoin dehydrogenase alpha subunit
MTGSVRRAAAGAEVSTGGSLISDAKLKQLYATMVRCRLLTQHAAGRRKQLASLYHASMGQEAIAAGWVIDLRPADTIALAPDDSIARLVRGVPLGEIVAQLYARRSSTNHSQTSSANDSAYNIIPPSCTAEQFSVVTEVASANKRKKKGNVVVAFTSMATNAGAHWNEALELAAKRSLPIIFVVENNPWFAPSFNPSLEPSLGRSFGPWKEHAGSQAIDEEGFLQSARSYGLPAITVDGNDVVAVYRVAYESLERVRQGGGPVLVEGRIYRQAGHAKSGPPRRGDRDPLTHMERYLKAKRLFTARWKDQLVLEFSQELDAAIKAARKAHRLAYL